jgi:choline-sulfatase
MHRQRGRNALLIVAASGLAAVGVGLWRHASATRIAANLVIITLDTTRADRLSPYGLMNTSMPALERLAREGVVFDQASSVAPLTLPAHASLFTGLLPTKHQVRDNADRPLGDDHLTLAEILKQRGYRAGAFVGSVVLDPARGLAQGFERYDAVDLDRAPPGSLPSRARQRRGDEVAAAAIRWLEDVGDAPFFLWAHLYDPHRPYDPPEPYVTKYVDPYVAEIGFADAQIGRLLHLLDARGLANRTIVIVAGDHGESLGEHGERDHGIFLYESVLKIPLIVRAPYIAPRRVAGVVRLTDVMPTVLELLGIPGPTTDGVSLVDLLTGRRSDLGLERYAESLYPRRFGWSTLHALRWGRYKVIDAPRPELYDLERDPFEERNVFHDRPTTATAMLRRLRELAGAERDRTPAGAAPRGREAQLSSLGYIGSAVPPLAPGDSLPDPKDCIGLLKPHDDARPSTEMRAAIPCGNSRMR